MADRTRTPEKHTYQQRGEKEMDLILDIVGLAAVLEFEITAHRTQGDRACRAPAPTGYAVLLPPFPSSWWIAWIVARLDLCHLFLRAAA